MLIFTKKQLQDKIDELVREGRWDGNENLLVEFAEHKSEYIKDVKNQAMNIMTHLLLIAYCAVHNREFETFNHWKQEVIAFSGNLTDTLLKGSTPSKTYNIKKKILHNYFIKVREMDTYNQIEKNWRGVMYKEKLSFGLDVLTINKYKEILYNLLELIAKSDIETMMKYVDSI